MSKKLDKAQMFVGQLREGMVDVKIMGYICWWNLRNVDITQADFINYLKASGLPEKYAREHNYRSAFTRALRNMEEKRIIRKVEETEALMSFQFTAEEVVGVGTDKRLDYDPETILVLDKKKYWDKDNGGDFLKALVKGKMEIRNKVAEHFYREKLRYNSSDMTRYIQNILDDEALIVSLRPQGAVYFVPVGYQATLQNVIALVRRLGGGSVMENLPVPDVAASRSLVGNAFAEEVEQFAIRLEKEVSEVEAGEKDASDKWRGTKLAKIKEILDRIGTFSTVLEESKKQELEASFAKLEERIAPGNRRLLLDENEEAEKETKEEPKKKNGEAA